MITVVEHYFSLIASSRNTSPVIHIRYSCLKAIKQNRTTNIHLTFICQHRLMRRWCIVSCRPQAASRVYVTWGMFLLTYLLTNLLDKRTEACRSIERGTPSIIRPLFTQRSLRSLQLASLKSLCIVRIASSTYHWHKTNCLIQLNLASNLLSLTAISFKWTATT